MNITKQEALEQIERLKQFIEEQDKPKVWKPEEGEKYYFVHRDGSVLYYGWKGDEIDINYYSMGNCYKTRAEAEQALKTGWIAKRQAEVRIERYCVENGIRIVSVEDMRDLYVQKHYAYYNYDAQKFECGNWGCTCTSNLIHFYTEKDAQRVIQACEAELRILFNVV
jgi:hypothetical protein